MNDILHARRLAIEELQKMEAVLRKYKRITEADEILRIIRTIEG